MEEPLTATVREVEARDDIDFPVDEPKLAELMLLLAEELADDPFGGATKLNKALFFAEFGHMRRTGKPISGARYQKLREGPAPRRLVPVRERLLREGAAEIVDETAHDYTRQRLRPRRPARRELFSAAELESIHAAVETVRYRTAAEVSALSHEHLGWRLVEEREDIPYVSALLLPDQGQPPERVRTRGRELAEQYADRRHHHDLCSCVSRSARSSYVLPTDLRGWLTRIANRIDRTQLWRDPAPVWRAEPPDGTDGPTT